MASEELIRASRLVKKFGPVTALNGLDLSVRAGEIHGFLGPNGAGKSTTLRILLGLIRPSGGSVRICGLDPWEDPVGVRRNIAYVPGDVNLWPDLSGGEIIDLLTGLRGGPDERLRRELIEEFELDPRRRARTYSKGNRQKVALVAAFARPAPLYLLDEPSAGLDPVMDAVFRRQVQRAGAEGATVLLSSHILSEVEHLCERITIIRAGTVVESGTLSELRHLRRTRFVVSGAPPAEVLEGLPGVHDVHTVPGGIEFEADQAHLPDVLAGLSRAGVGTLTANPPSLEELFLRHYTHGSDGAAPGNRPT